jgi:UDP-N-acetyl-D-galactosamine dehydrogenase
VKKIVAMKKRSEGARVLVMGATFKENVSDIRNSKVSDVINELKAFGLQVDVTDPHASSKDLKEHYGYGLIDEIGHDYDAILLAVNHDEYLNLDDSYFKKISHSGAIFFDVKGSFKKKIKSLDYLSL